jgi:universal stress protein A
MYQHVLVAIDLFDIDIEVLKAASKIAQDSKSLLTVLHICESHVTGYGPTMSNHHIANEMELRQQCFPRLKEMIAKATIKPSHTQILFGHPADSIHHYVHEYQCDLIVIGSHGYSGIKALLGSTANKVLHGASCDVYTVRISE